ncbi:hypothetical protein [Rhodococcoides kyotonense]|uniref:hypothetical protein n=1 Tax=Rhodococcoides kyotonense TaxID=398843 RepID=UPI0011321774|nr:hypothetical protein [Rhodococcus kyotonensis]
MHTDVRLADYGSLEPSILDGDLDLLILSRSYLSDFADAAGYLSTDYSCDGSFNLNNFCNGHFDALLAELANTPDVGVRQAVLSSAARILAEQRAGIPLFHTGSITVARDSVQNFESDAPEQKLLTLRLSGSYS